MKIVFMLAMFSVSSAFASPMRVAPGELGSGMLYVPCSFDSHAEECLLDTGSDISNIKDDSFSETYPSVGKLTGEGLSGEPTVCDLIDVAQVALGDSSVAHPKLVRCPSNVQDGGSVAGLTSLAGKTLHLDFTESTFSLTDSIPVVAGTSPLTRYPLGHFGFPVSISGMTVNAVVDTGAGLSTIDKNFVQTHPDQAYSLYNEGTDIRWSSPAKREHHGS
jgi:hypothetical protein